MGEINLFCERAITFIDGYIHGVKIEMVRRAVIAILEEMGELPEELEIRIQEEKDLIIMKIWLVLAKRLKT